MILAFRAEFQSEIRMARRYTHHLQSVAIGGATWHLRGASMYYLGAISEIHS